MFPMSGEYTIIIYQIHFNRIGINGTVTFAADKSIDNG